jgi:predicted DNA binding CopG/RHH family protein
MRKKIEKEIDERDVYLKTDFGAVLSKLEPLDLDLEFPSPTQSINIRLPRDVLNRIRVIADDQDVPYQSLIKMWLVQRLKTVA